MQCTSFVIVRGVINLRGYFFLLTMPFSFPLVYLETSTFDFLIMIFFIIVLGSEGGQRIDQTQHKQRTKGGKTINEVR